MNRSPHAWGRAEDRRAGEDDDPDACFLIPARYASVVWLGTFVPPSPVRGDTLSTRDTHRERTEDALLDTDGCTPCENAFAPIRVIGARLRRRASGRRRR